MVGDDLHLAGEAVGLGFGTRKIPAAEQLLVTSHQHPVFQGGGYLDLQRVLTRLYIGGNIHPQSAGVHARGLFK